MNCFKMNRLVLYLCLCFAYGVLTQRKLPPYVNICKRFDPEISKCWEKTVIALKPYLAKGIPEFDVPPVTAFRINQIHLNQNNTRNVNFVADLFNLTLYGVENFDVPYTKADFKNLMVEEAITFPKLKLNGHYRAKGKVLIFEFEGEGDMEGEFEDVKVNGTWYLKLIQKRGKEHLQIDRDKIDVNPGRMYLYLHDLFRGNPEITKNVNNAINENVDVLYTDFKPLLEKTISTILDQYFNRVYTLYPFDVLLPIN